MPRTTTTGLATPGFIANFKSIRQNTGRQVDWANVGAGYIDPATGKKRLKAGTAVGELLGAGKISPRVAATNPATCILLTDAVEDAPYQARTGFGCLTGGEIYENLLPDAAGGPPKVLLAAIKTELKAADCTFHFETYEDNR